MGCLAISCVPLSATERRMAAGVEAAGGALSSVNVNADALTGLPRDGSELPAEVTSPGGEPGGRGSRWLHRASVAVLVAAFPLIFMGGLVTTKGAGMSVPDWPNSYGYNMFLFPPRLWQGGIFFEHTHRLLGTLVGFLAIIQTGIAWGPARGRKGRALLGVGTLLVALLAMAAGVYWMAGSLSPKAAEKWPHLMISLVGMTLTLGVCWACRTFEPRRWVRWLCAAILGAIIVQGILGGERVDQVNVELAIVHGVFAQFVVCGLAFACVVTGRWWMMGDVRDQPVNRGAVRRVARLGWVVFALVSVQLVLGAMMRHYGAGLAVPDVPLIYGKFVPPTTDAGLAAANAYRVSLQDTTLRPTTLGQIWLHSSHRAGAMVVAIGVTWVCLRGMKTRTRKIRSLAHWLGIGVVAQITLGLLTVYFRKDAVITTGHHMVGALMLMGVFVLAVRSARLARSGPSAGSLGSLGPTSSARVVASASSVERLPR